MARPATPFRDFNASPEVIRLVVMMYVRYPLSLRNVDGRLAERGIDVSIAEETGGRASSIAPTRSRATISTVGS
jgi:transposase-like protein